MVMQPPPQRPDIPDVGKVIQQFMQSAPKFKGGLLSIILIFLAVSAAFSSYYTIEPEEVGVVLRVGEYLTTTPPGLHFKLPLGIDNGIVTKSSWISNNLFLFLLLAKTSLF
jgi:membrane protease subunit HflK